MFRNSNTVDVKDSELLEKIKRDIEIQLGKRGVLISGIDMMMNSDTISFSIIINSTRRLA